MYDKKKALSLKLIKLVTEGILLGMQYLSAKRVTHNFINSTSVYISRGYLPKLGNFEYAHREGDPANSVNYTLSAEEFHFPYMAPELHRDDKTMPNIASDIYR